MLNLTRARVKLGSYKSFGDEDQVISLVWDLKSHLVIPFDQNEAGKIKDCPLSIKQQVLISFPSSFPMQIFLALALVPALCAAAPSADSDHGYGYKPKCHTVYKTIYETIYEEKCHTYYDTKCHTEYDTKYKTEYKKDCHTYYEQACKKYYETIYEKKCETYYSEEVSSFEPY